MRARLRVGLRYAAAVVIAGVAQSAGEGRTQTAPPADDIVLSAVPGPGVGEVTLRWTGGLPAYTAYRSQNPASVIAPSNVLGVTNSTAWIDAPPAGAIFYYLVVGSGCASDGGCPTGHCVDGYCCDSACDAVCQACNVAGAEGHCMPVPRGDDPGDACGALAACDGTGVCLKEIGAACAGGNECLNGLCVDGFCCESSCAGTCVQCDRAGSPGRCVAVPSGTDPDNECPVDPVSTCDRTGVCSGNGACALYAAGTVCVPGMCSGALISNPDACDGQGICVDGGTTSCSPYTCSAPGPGGCRTSCVTVADCAAGFTCDQTAGACVACAAGDDPDLLFFDANCDGIDGDVARAIFVSVTAGSDANAGTSRTAPMATIQAGISRALSTGRPHVYVSRGTYNGPVNMVSGVSLFGGYDSGTGWARGTSNEVVISSSTPSSGRIVGINIPAISGGEIQLISVRTANTTATGVDTYGIHINGALGTRLIRVNVLAGNAGPGTAGADGGPGGVGVSGHAGALGSCDGSTGGVWALGGEVCGGDGGWGGYGGDEGAQRGADGRTGSGGACGGTGGAGGSTGGDGGNGCNGAAGANGGNGAGGSTAGSIVGGFFAASIGGNGSSGFDGSGGGGGGGGGGQGCTFCNNGSGNGGGGGGAGGCGGGPGIGGEGGNGSFGIFLVNAFNITISNSTIAAGRGGTGGAGGDGGGGGGGDGGGGGGGGGGGHGGGGAGGPSYAIYRVNSTIIVSGNALSTTGGGAGGASFGNAGPTGRSGLTF